MTGRAGRPGASGAAFAPGASDTTASAGSAGSAATATADNAGVDGETRTLTAFATAPSRRRVYQFHHVDAVDHA